MVRFLKGVYESRPSVPQYVETWDVKVVLKFLANQHPPTKLSLKQLTLKLVMLVSLVSGQRGQSIQLLDINCMSQTETTCSFVITQNVKQSRPGTKQPVIKLEAYPIDERLCVVTLLKEYLSRTASLRGKHSQLFISYVKPFSPVSRDTISRWVKTMQEAGIDTAKFKPQSTRAASTSAAQQNAVPLENILTAAGWKSDGVFSKYYNKPVDCKSFPEGVLT